MELLAVIVALESLKGEGHNVTIYSDSSYVVNAVEKGWLATWRKKGFKGKKNTDLWRRYLHIAPKHNVKLVWVKGHANIPGNERCDRLAVQAAESNDHEIDYGYENHVLPAQSGLNF